MPRLLAPLLLALAALPAPAARAQERPLPEARKLVGRLLEHQRAVDAARESYTFKVRETELRADRRDGRVDWKRRSEKLWQAYPSRRLPLQRLIEKDGRPLTAKEERKEDQRLEREVRDGERRARERERRITIARDRVERDRLERDRVERDRVERDGEPGDEPAPELEAEDDEDNPRQVRLRDVLAATRLETVAREREDGRDILVIDFTGNPEHRARSRGEKIAKKLDGRLWVDERDLQIVRVDGRIGRISIAGGIVAKLKEATFFFEQRRVDSELWLPVRGEFEYRVRVLLVKGIEARVIADFFDYQRFGAETSIAFEGGGEDATDPDCGASEPSGPSG